MKKLTTILASLLLTSCIHNEYLYDGMIGKDYVKFEIIKETRPGKFKDLPGRVKEKEYVPFYNLMTIITADRDTVQLYDIDNNLKPDYVVSSYEGLGFRIAPIETFKPDSLKFNPQSPDLQKPALPESDLQIFDPQEFILSQWDFYLTEIKKN